MHSKQIVSALALAATASALPNKLSKRQSAPLDLGPNLVDQPQTGNKYTTAAGAAANVAGIINKILSILNYESPSWDFETYPEACRVEMEAKKDENFEVRVACANGGEQIYSGNTPPNVPSDYEDSRIGPFRITWDPDNKGHVSDSKNVLDLPVIQFAYIQEGAAWNVDAIGQQDENLCKYSGIDQTTGVNVGPVISKWWDCGVPIIGKSGGTSDTDVDSQGPVNDAGFASGWCGVHVVQHQKPDPAVDPYTYDIFVKDNNEDEVGKVEGSKLNGGEKVEVTSKLPSPVVVTSGNVDDDAIYFDYNGAIWGSNDQEHHCNFGSYDNGKREGDCGFTC